MKKIILRLIICGFISSAQAAIEPELFFALPDLTSVNLSPNGKRIATVRYAADQQMLEVMSVPGKARLLTLEEADVPGGESTIKHWEWIDDQCIIFQVSAVKKGIEDLLDTKTSSQWFVLDVDRSAQGKAHLRQVLTNGWLVDALPQEPGKFLFAKSGSYSKVYRIDAELLNKPGGLSKLAAIDGGQFTKSNEVSSVSGFALRWFFDGKGKVRAALHYDREGELSLSSFDDKGEAELAHTWRSEEKDQKDGAAETKQKKVIPVALAGDSGKFYGLDINEDDERSVYLVDYSAGTEELVYEADSFKVVDLILSPTDGLLIGARMIRNGVLVDDYFAKRDSEEAQIPAGGDRFVSELDHSADNLVSLQYREGHDLPGEYRLLFSGGRKELVLGSHFPQLQGRLSSKLIDGVVTVEGLDIPYLLSLPARRTAPAPLIVLPHGGPVGVFDDHYYDPITQYFVSAGYAVLRVNFRGSSGYSTELKEAGKKQWGKLMLEDIHQATLAVAGRGDVDEKRVCAVGVSYGGYASTMLMIRHPGLYRCAASLAGVTDVNLMLNSPRLSDKQVEWAREYVGDAALEYEQLKAVSPVYLAEQVTRPIFIAHGGEDRIVDPEHAYRLKLMLEKYGKPFSWHFEPEVGHEFGEAEAKARLFGKVKAFVDSNIH